MEQMKTNNGKRGGLLKGKPHYDKDGNSLGGIKAVVTDAGGKPVELEGGEVIINKEASKKYWKELSKINQSAGNGVQIGPPMGADEDPEEFKDGGRVIEFNPNHIPNKWVVKYAISIKENHPEIWKLGGNIFGNEAFINLRRVIDRGHWLDSEEWMYIKWRSYVARHKQDFRIAGVVAMLKWCDKVDKGWAYMKDLIEEKIENIKSKETSSKSKMENGGEVKKPIDEISGVLLNHLKKYSKEVYGEDIDDSSFMLMAVKEDNKYQAQKVSATTKSGKEIVVKVQELYMENGGEVEGDDFLEVKNYILQRHPKKNDVFKGGKVDGYKIVKTAKIIKSYGTLFELWLLDTKKNKLGSFNRRIVSYYPNKKRISDFNKVPSSTTKGEFYQKWNDETLEGKMSKGGELSKGIKAEKEHQDTIDKIYSHKVKKSKAAELIAKDHLKEDKKYYSKLEKIESKKFAGGGNADRPDIKVGDIVTLESKRKGLFNVEILYITEKWITFNDITNNVKNTSNETPKFYESFRGFVNAGQTPTTQTTKSVKHTVSNSTIIENLEVYNEDLGEMNFDEATEKVKELGEGWRLPTKEEFEDRLYPNQSRIPNLKAKKNRYWSSTEFGDTAAWGFYFRFENAFNDYKNIPYYVRPVRDLSISTIQQPVQQAIKKEEPIVKRVAKTIEPEPVKRKFDSEKDYLTIFANYFVNDNAVSTQVTDKMKRTNIIKDFVLSTEGIGGFDKEKLKEVYSYINEQ